MLSTSVSSSLTSSSNRSTISVSSNTTIIKIQITETDAIRLSQVKNSVVALLLLVDMPHQFREAIQSVYSVVSSIVVLNCCRQITTDIIQ